MNPKRLTAMALLMVAAATPLHADQAVDGAHVDVMGAFVSPDSGRVVDDGAGFSVLYGQHWYDDFWLEGRVFGNILETGVPGATDFYQFGLGLDFLVADPERDGFSPFVLAGLGLVTNDVVPDDKDSTDILVNVGAGFWTREFTGHGLRFRAEVRAVFDGFDGGMVDFQAGAGVSVPLGRSTVVEKEVIKEVIREVPVQVAAPPPPPAPPGDEDKDGVLNPWDRCPGTIYGAEVDHDGCLIRGQTLILDDINFRSGSALLLPESETRLDAVAVSLGKRPDLRFEVAGHTDSTAPEDYNRWLSQIRADEVARYLASRGVAADRMTTRGYGEAVPIDSNSTESGKARNRRVEFRFLH